MSRINLRETSLARHIRMSPGRHFKTSVVRHFETSTGCHTGTSRGWSNRIFRESLRDVGRGRELLRELFAGSVWIELIENLIFTKCHICARASYKIVLIDFVQNLSSSFVAWSCSVNHCSTASLIKGLLLKVSVYLTLTDPT